MDSLGGGYGTSGLEEARTSGRDDIDGPPESPPVRDTTGVGLGVIPRECDGEVKIGFASTQGVSCGGSTAHGRTFSRPN